MLSPSSYSSSTSVRTTVEAAIIRALAYGDIFDYPLTATEVHRYLTGIQAPARLVNDVLGNGQLVPHRLIQHEEFFTLPGREAIIATRRRRENNAKKLWPEAIRYGYLFAALPFVRMVAVTGSLAVNNVEPNADIDYLIITANDRLWLCRAFTILLVRLAARHDISLCPNYFLSERALVFADRNLYTAHELAQMVPLSGLNLYRRLRRLNQWTAEWLPNAADLPPQANGISPAPRSFQRRFQRITEFTLRTAVGGYVERWEMERKMRKFNHQRVDAPDETEAAFSADWCKGHFGGHAGRVLNAYRQRVRAIEAEE